MSPTSECPPPHSHSCLSRGTYRYFSRVTLTSAILKVDVVFDVAMMSTPNVCTTELRDRLYNQCINNTCYYSFFIYPMGRIKVCTIRFVSTGENCGKPCPICKKNWSHMNPLLRIVALAIALLVWVKFPFKLANPNSSKWRMSLHKHKLKIESLLQNWNFAKQKTQCPPPGPLDRLNHS